MAKNRHGAEQIIPKLREAEVELARGLKVPEVCRKFGITEQTYYRWRRVPSESQASRTVVVSGGIESPAETAETKAIIVQ